MPTLLCLGATPTMQRSMYFERVAVDGVNRAAEVHEYASGKSINVARVAAELGADVRATGFVGGDRGEEIRRELDARRIRRHFITIDAQTRLCTTVIDRAAGTVTELVEEAAPVRPERWEALLEEVRRIGAASPVWVLSGSLAPGGPTDFYARCIDEADRSGARVILDARGEALRQAIGRARFIAKLNDDELAETVGAPAETLRDPHRLRDAMASILPPDGAAIVTLGRRGAAVAEGDRFWRVNTPTVAAINPIGSGDAFAAGAAVALLRGESLADACRLAAACGAANAAHPLAGHIDAQLVRDLEARVQICPL